MVPCEPCRKRAIPPLSDRKARCVRLPQGFRTSTNLAQKALIDGSRVYGFGPQEGKLVCIVLNLLGNAHPGGVTAGKAVMEQNRPPAGRSRLQEGRHLARMERVNTGVVVSSEEHHRGISRGRPDVLVGRVPEQIAELLFVLRGAIFRLPVRAHKKILVAQHIQQWISAPNSRK